MAKSRDFLACGGVGQQGAGMIVRTHSKGDSTSVAVYSDCERYRFRLGRQWGDDPQLVCILLNPSTATETRNDPTVERCERRARAMGFGGVQVVNLFAWRSTDPRGLRAASDPVGPGNDAVLLDAAGRSGMVLCGWGLNGALQGRGAEVAALLDGAGVALWHLGLTTAGAPRHPLYVGYAQAPLRWDPVRAWICGSGLPPVDAS
jgi:hypothetical protein